MVDSLSLFPREIVLEILKWTSVQDVLRFGFTCKKYHRWANDVSLWIHFIQQEFKYPADKFKERFQSDLTLNPWKLYRKVKFECQPKCVHVITRGRNKGDCQNKAMEGSRYCKWCSRKKEVQDEMVRHLVTSDPTGIA